METGNHEPRRRFDFDSFDDEMAEALAEVEHSLGRAMILGSIDAEIATQYLGAYEETLTQDTPQDT